MKQWTIAQLTIKDIDNKAQQQHQRAKPLKYETLKEGNRSMQHTLIIDQLHLTNRYKR